jgi:hypothetical protein
MNILGFVCVAIVAFFVLALLVVVVSILRPAKQDETDRFFFDNAMPSTPDSTTPVEGTPTRSVQVSPTLDLGAEQRWVCPTCGQEAWNASDAFFRSLPESVTCRCAAEVPIDAKEINRSLGVNVVHQGCRLSRKQTYHLYIPPDVWCPECGQNLIPNWRALIVYEGADEAAHEVAEEWGRETAMPLWARAFEPPPNAQRVEPPIAFCRCDNCGDIVEWLTPDGRKPWSTDLEDNSPLRCSNCGRWAVVRLRRRTQ